MKRLPAKFAAVAVLAAVALPGVASASRSTHPEGVTGDSRPDDHPDSDARCNGRPFVLVKISDLAAAEKPRADKMDRNANGFVCRMDIPGRGHGNTRNNSNIKDDKA